MKSNKMYQVSTIQALSLGYTRPVVTVAKLLSKGDTGLGAFESVNGEMIVLDGNCYQANDEGDVYQATPEMGIPFASVSTLDDCKSFSIDHPTELNSLRELLTQKIEEDFGLNSMHIARIDGIFSEIKARSESPLIAHHVSLKEILSATQNEFSFHNIEGTLVCIYYPEYMKGINATGWHIHFLSSDFTKGGHVFEVKMPSAKVRLSTISSLEIQLPEDPAFDTYSLHEASDEEIKEVEQK